MDEAGDEREAWRTYHEALGIKPHDLYTLVLLWMMNRDGDGDEVPEPLALQLEAQNRRLADVCLELGMDLIARGHDTKAAEALERAVGLDPGAIRARYYLARVLAARGDIHGARSWIR